MKTVTIYTDGACSGNPGRAAGARYWEYNGIEKMLSGGEAQTTNNRMELTAVIQALLSCANPVLSSCIPIPNTCSTRSKKAGPGAGGEGLDQIGQKKPALNPDLWEMLLGLVSQHEMHYHWVKGPRATSTTTAATSRPCWRARNSNKTSTSSCEDVDVFDRTAQFSRCAARSQSFSRKSAGLRTGIQPAHPLFLRKTAIEKPKRRHSSSDRRK